MFGSHLFGTFVIKEDIKYAKCRSCDELVARGGVNTKGFNSTNLVNHTIKAKSLQRI